jgi:hypothetical protein
MLSPDVRVSGFTAEEWQRLAHVVRPPPTKAAANGPSGPSGGVVALTTGERLRKLVSTKLGRLEISGEVWPCPLAELSARHQARWAVELSTGALEHLADRFAERLRPSDTYLSQTLEFFVVLRELESNGELRVFPWPIAEWPVPTERAVVRALDALCPVDRVALLGVFSRGELYTAMAARRGPRGIDAIVGPQALRGFTGLLSGDWQRDYRYLSEAAERALGPLALGCFAELYTFQALSGASPGSWAAAAAARDVVFAPISPGLAVPLGLDAGRAVWASVRGFAERLGAGSWLSAGESLRPAFARGMPAFEEDVKAWLGFDPLRLLARLLAR